MLLVEIIDKGGFVVWILLAYSVLALALVLERLVNFLLLGRPPAVLEQQLAQGETQLAGLLQQPRTPEIVMVRGLLAARAAGVKDLGRVASRLGSEQLQAMERGFRTLGILGNTAPLLGLFGTIIGMIKAFMVIEQAGGRVDAQALAGGIWEAMLTTGVGLAVAIPIILLLHLLEGMADRRAQAMRVYASLVLENLPSSPPPDTTDAIQHREGVIHAV
jgi:biopolymer transport protein ExbB